MLLPPSRSVCSIPCIGATGLKFEHLQPITCLVSVKNINCWEYVRWNPERNKLSPLRVIELAWRWLLYVDKINFGFRFKLHFSYLKREFQNGFNLHNSFVTDEERKNDLISRFPKALCKETIIVSQIMIYHFSRLLCRPVCILDCYKDQLVFMRLTELRSNLNFVTAKLSTSAITV